MRLKFRVVKLTKALKPEKSAQKRVQVSAQASDIRIFALVVSAVKLRCDVPVSPSLTLFPYRSSPLHPDKFSVSSRVHFASASSLPVRPDKRVRVSSLSDGIVHQVQVQSVSGPTRETTYP